MDTYLGHLQRVSKQGGHEFQDARLIHNVM
jgi:hypothetical protein